MVPWCWQVASEGTKPLRRAWPETERERDGAGAPISLSDHIGWETSSGLHHHPGMPSSPGAFRRHLPLRQSLRNDNFSLSSALHEVNDKVSRKPCVYRMWYSQMILWGHLISQSFHFRLISNCSSFHLSLLQRNASYSWGTNYLHTGIKPLQTVKGWVLGRNTKQESQGSTCFL